MQEGLIYYKPEMEELHIGFEYEMLYPNGQYKKLKVGDEIDHPELKEFQDELMKIAHGVIRVKNLTHADLVELGFELHSENNVNSFTYQSIKESSFRLTVSFGNPAKLSAFHYSGWETPNFNIKNKSELDKLIKMLDR